MRIETERLSIYPIGDDDMRSPIEREQDAELRQAYSEMVRHVDDRA